MQLVLSSQRQIKGSFAILSNMKFAIYRWAGAFQNFFIFSCVQEIAFKEMTEYGILKILQKSDRNVGK